MIKVKPYKPAYRYFFEKLIKAQYKELNSNPPDDKNILNTIGFFTSFPQCGNIYLLFYKDKPIGYSIIIYQWRLKNGGISCIIDELFINENYRKYKPEINLIEILIKQEKVHTLEIHRKKIHPSSKRKTFRFFKFERYFGPVFVKILEEE